MSNTYFLKIQDDLTLPDLADIVGARNIPDILHANGLTRSRNIGEQYYEKCTEIVSALSPVDWKRKSEILNQFSNDSDVFEYAAIQDEAGWKVLSHNMSFKDALYIPETVQIDVFDDVIHSDLPIGHEIYKKTIETLRNYHRIDTTIFANYSNIRHVERSGRLAKTEKSSLYQWFNLPWGEIVFYSALADASVDIPAYPEPIKDGRHANYDTMPDLLYQYEPWQIYRSAGAREINFEFKLHRQMWSGDGRDGKANELIRFIESCVYAKYSGSCVYTDTVTLYIKGKPFITGVLTACDVIWDHPIGLDGFYLSFTLSFTIVEVSPKELNFDTVKKLPLIG